MLNNFLLIGVHDQKILETTAIEPECVNFVPCGISLWLCTLKLLLMAWKNRQSTLIHVWKIPWKCPE